MTDKVTARDWDGALPSDLAETIAEIESIEVPFLRDVVAALIITGHDLAYDADRLVVEVQAHGPWLGRILGVVRPLARSVTFYAVHPEQPPEDRLSEACELAVRGTEEQFDVAFEVTLPTGMLSARTAVTLGPAEVTMEALALLLMTALEQAETQLVRYRPAVDAVWTGRLSAAEAAAQVRLATEPAEPDTA